MDNNIQSSTSGKHERVNYPSDFPYSNNIQEDEIDLSELFRAIWAGKLFIIVITTFFAITAVFYAKSLPNTYKASTLLTPASSQGGAGGLAGLAGSFGGLASMAGINIGGGESDKSALALEIIKSRGFIERFINKHNLLIPIMAGKEWRRENDLLLLDEEVYDSNNDTWIRKASPPKKVTPSPWEAYERFLKIVDIEQDKATSMITINITFFSPNLAKQWLTWLVKDINEYMREQDELEAQSSIQYLQEKLEETQLKSMEGVFYQLIEEQSKTLMLTKVKPEYVLKTIDKPQVPDIKEGPKRALIVILAVLLAGILSTLLVLIRYFYIKSKNTPLLIDNER